MAATARLKPAHYVGAALQRFPNWFSLRTAYENWLFRGHATERLTYSEFKVLMFIVDRTMRWNRTCTHLSYRHFMEGDDLSLGCGVCERVAVRAVKKLAAEGYITVQQTSKLKRYNLYTLNLAPQAMEDDMLKMPKKPKASKSATEDQAPPDRYQEEEQAAPRQNQDVEKSDKAGVSGSDLQVQNDDLALTSRSDSIIELKQTNSNIKQFRAAGPGSRDFSPTDTEQITNPPGEQVGSPPGKDPAQRALADLHSAVADAQARSAEARARRPAAVNVPDLLELWGNTLRDKYGEDYVYPAPSGKELGQMKHLRNRLPAGTDMAAFIAFCAEWWFPILRTTMPWAKYHQQKCEPTIGFLLANIAVFSRAYNDRETYEGGDIVRQMKVAGARRGNTPKPAPQGTEAQQPCRYENQPDFLSRQLAQQRKERREGTCFKDGGGAWESDKELPEFPPLEPWE